jgi:hypothetical protein
MPEKNRKWFNPFQYVDPPLVNSKTRDARASAFTFSTSKFPKSNMI